MLQQILNDLYIDPDLLSELDDEQKQTLFCKMREEQVRRWLIYEEQYEKNLLKQQKKTPKLGKQKQVRFLMGTDGNPWTWVMGEHPTDRSIEEILVEEAKEKARLLAEKEALELRKKESNSTVLSSSSNKSLTSQQEEKKTEDSAIEERKREEWLQMKQEQLLKVKNKSDGKVGDDSLVRIKEERTIEIFKNIQETQRKATELSEIIRRQEEEQWKERERKAKETEIQIREIARKAREEHKRMSDSNLFRLVSLPDTDIKKENSVNRTKSADFSVNRLSQPELNSAHADTSVSLKQRRCAAFSINNRNRTRPSKPPSRNAIIEWFKNEEALKDSGCDPATQEVAPWFHGIISRTEAEDLLNRTEVGTFLVRVSERIWGYAISYKAAERCKHFLIDASSGEYQFFGNDHLIHQKLSDLVNYHKKVPITMNGQEFLLNPCRQKNTIPDYLELFEKNQK